ncbi:ribosome maturation factor RimM [uncultured Anaerococcus sp.]|uniref:ribosome maturation factor RimM n=1 Tax=uncultured Anaerococcus sp. TaxID=293428 RepID=UPI002889FA06|nr:ribosome maturation factor RimM [uncultured Anaerococcus sp.]
MRISVGEIVASHGIRGNLKVNSLTDNEKRFEKGSKVFIEDELLTIRESFKKKNQVIIGFEEYDNINDVLKFVGKDITIDEKDLGKLAEGEIYIHDLYGLKVISDGQIKGEIKDVISGVYPNDVYLVQTENGEVLLPALRAIIKEINTEKGFIEVENFSDYE